MTIFRHAPAKQMVVSVVALAGVLMLTMVTGGFAACANDADAPALAAPAEGGTTTTTTTTTIVCTVSNSC